MTDNTSIRRSRRRRGPSPRPVRPSRWRTSRSAASRPGSGRTVPPVCATILELSRGHGDSDYMVYEDERTTYEENFRIAATLAHVLRDRFGVELGDRVAIAMRNLPEWAMAFWGAAAAGGVVVPLNAWWTSPELLYGLADSGTTVAFVDGAPGPPGTTSGRAPRPAGRGRHPRGPHEVPTLPRAGAGRLLRRAGRHTRRGDRPARCGHRPRRRRHHLLHLRHDGETQGRRGHTSQHGHQLDEPLLLEHPGRVAVADKRGPRDDDRGGPGAYLLSVPLFHATGCHSILVANTAAGNKLVMMHHWDPERALELIERERIVTFGGVPAMVMQVIDSPSFATRDTSSVRSVAYGGAPAPPDLVRRIKEHFPVSAPSNGYGLTETSSVTTMVSGDDYVRSPTASALPSRCATSGSPTATTATSPDDLPTAPTSPASCGSKGPTWCGATGTSPRPPRRPSPRGGCTR